MSPDTAQEVEFLLLDHRPPVDDGTSLALLQGTRQAAILHTAPPPSNVDRVMTKVGVGVREVTSMATNRE